jgi:hypothetical protein
VPKFPLAINLEGHGLSVPIARDRPQGDRTANLDCARHLKGAPVRLTGDFIRPPTSFACRIPTPRRPCKVSGRTHGRPESSLSYDDPLTETDFAAFQPNAEVVRYLELTRERLGLQKHAMNVLDWGSGRGEYVTWLRDAGYNAFGAEIRREASERGKQLINARGHDYA